MKSKVIFNCRGWYSGNVLTIKASCRNCGDKVIVKGHFHEERDVLATSGMREYQWGFDGGSIQQTANLIHMKHNGSIDQIVALPQASWDEICLRVAVPLRGVNMRNNYRITTFQPANHQKESIFTLRHSSAAKDLAGDLSQLEPRTVPDSKSSDSSSCWLTLIH